MNDLKKIKYIKLGDILAVFLFLIILPFSIIFKLYNKMRRKRLWLICELKDAARDNGYHFFRYVREHHINDYCFYAIDKKSNDYKKIEKYGNVIQFGGLKYWLFYMSADKNIITNKATDPSHALFYILHKYFNLYNNCVFLQHGITKDDTPMFYYKNAKFRLFICGAQREYEYILENYGYPKNYVKYTGFSRFDNLHNLNINSKQILIMPTWRNWLGRDVNFLGKIEDFTKTQYFKEWNGLLNNESFINYIETNDIIVKFYPHYQMQKYINDFKVKSKNILVLNNDDEDIQKLLKESALLITDFSSVYMDFAYMNKPLVYFQFDREKYRKFQLQQGYFEYEKDGFGKICLTQEEVVNTIKGFNLKYQPDEMYLKRMNSFFPIKDSNNSKRIYEEIKKIDKK